MLKRVAKSPILLEVIYNIFRIFYRQRLLAKFTENDHEKVERLMELHFKYLERVELAEDKIEREGLDKIEDEEEIYLRRLSGGLFSLQLIDYIVADSSSSGAASVKQRVLKILNQRNASIKTIRNIIEIIQNHKAYKNSKPSLFWNLKWVKWLTWVSLHKV